MKTTKKNLSIDVADEGLFNYGQRVYVVESCRKEVFDSMSCNICDNTGVVKIKGQTFVCPKCNGRLTPIVAVINLYDYRVKTYVINNIEIQGPNIETAYNGNEKLEDFLLPTVTYSGFCEEDGVVDNKVFNGFYVDGADPIDSADNVKIGGNGCNSFASVSLEEAEIYCRRLHERQMKALDEFNKEYKRSHEYPFAF